MSELTSRLQKIAKSTGAKEVKQQRTMVARPQQSSKPGPKNTWKKPGANYVRLYTQLVEADRNLLKSSIAGGVLHQDFESVDHFINEAIIQLLGAYGLEPEQGSTLA